MMRGVWIVIGVNILAVALIGTLAYRFGGGFTAGPFPPNTPVVMMRLVPVENLPARTAQAGTAPASRARPDLPAEYRAVEPSIERWETGADGRMRLRD